MHTLPPDFWKFYEFEVKQGDNQVRPQAAHWRPPLTGAGYARHAVPPPTAGPGMALRGERDPSTAATSVVWWQVLVVWCGTAGAWLRRRQ